MAMIPDPMSSEGPAPTPTPSYRRPLVPDSGRLIGAAGAQLGDTVSDAADQNFLATRNMARAQAANASLDHELAVKQTLQQTQEAIATGQVPYQQAPQVFDKALEGIQAPSVPNLDPIASETLNRTTQRTLAGAQAALATSVGIARRADFQDQFGQNLNKLAKLAALPDANIEDINNQAEAFRPMAIEAGLPASKIDEALSNFKDQNWLGDAVQASIFAKEDPAALKQLQHDLTADDGYYAGKLNPEKRDMVLRGVMNDQYVLQARTEHEQDKRENKAMRAVFSADQQISSGVPMTTLAWEQLEQTVKGTTSQPDFKELMAGEQQVQTVLREPVDQQMAYVQQRAAQLDQNGGTLRDRANLMRLQSAVQQNVTTLEKAPLLFNANRNGQPPQALDFSQMSDPDTRGTINDAMTDRMATLSALRGKYGNQVGLKPLLPQEAGALASSLENGTATDRTKLMVALRDSIGNDDAYQAAMRQVAPDHPVLAIAGDMVSHSAPASQPAWFNQDNAPRLIDVQRMLSGEALLSPMAAGTGAPGADKEKGGIKSTVVMPQELDSSDKSGLRSAFTRASGDLFRDRPQLGDTYFAAYKSAYAGLIAETGNTTGVLDNTLAKKATQIALGNLTSFNGQTVSVPQGMDPRVFKGLIKNAVAATAQATGAPAGWEDKIRGYQLRELGGLGSGRYALVNGNAIMARPDGRGPMLVDLHAQYLPGRETATIPSAGARASHAPGPAEAEMAPDTVDTE